MMVVCSLNSNQTQIIMQTIIEVFKIKAAEPIFLRPKPSESKS